MMFWIGCAMWVVACVLAIRWALPRIDAAEEELEREEAIHEEAIQMDRQLESRSIRAWIERGGDASPPILNQSERWQERARVAESADDTWDGAA